MSTLYHIAPFGDNSKIPYALKRDKTVADALKARPQTEED